MLTINTHPGAMIALQNLNHTHRDLVQGQERITTGLKVASARDNGGVYAIAQGMRSELGGLRATQQSLDRAMSVIEVTLAASQAISEILIEMRQVAVALSDPSLEAPSFTALYREYETLFRQTIQITENAAFADINLLDGSTLTMAPLAGISISGVNLTSLLKDGVSTDPPAVDQNGLTNGFSGTVTGDLFGINRGDFNGTVWGSAFSIVEGNFNGTVWGHMGSAVRGDFTGDILGDFYGLIMGNFTGTIYGRNMGYIDGAVNGVLHDGAVSPPNPFENIAIAEEHQIFEGMLTGAFRGIAPPDWANSWSFQDMAQALDTVSGALHHVSAHLANQLSAAAVQNTFAARLSDTLETGIGNLVDADMARESARLQALQVKQQLGLQALSIANSAPGAVLGLFDPPRSMRA